jgi:hypothetical protein
MIELKHNQLRFSFPEVHPKASMTIDFQRTLRIPDDDRTYPLPPGLGSFPLRHVDDHADRVPETWKRHGGVMLPMYQRRASAVSLRSRPRFPLFYPPLQFDGVARGHRSEPAYRAADGQGV